MTTITGTFTIEMHPAEAIDAAAHRFDFTKRWGGGVEGESQGTMLTAGDPEEGNAGYVAIEVFDGVLDGRRGTITLMQLGTMIEGATELEYVISPGSGTGELAGSSGTLTIDGIDDDGVHQATFELR